jgi:putative two-component system response regulator
MISTKILLVDDDDNLLKSYQRHLSEDFRIDTASGAKEALEMIQSNGSYAVIISDLKMPGMDGIEFLSRVKEIAPQSVRMMLTGNADLETSIGAVNEGNIFRFLLKPCPVETLKQAISSGVRQYKLIEGEKEIMKQLHTKKILNALKETIQLIGMTLEAKDPYTAGHQKRVARLASAIAEEMGLAEEKIEGIHFAGLIHDIGKVYIPAEILNRPGTLSTLEFELIKTHAQVGYDIIQHVKFPWPIAEAIFQHHERMDGSGYPSGFSGEQIIIEARILAVADVVEAMATHRPYRPACSLEKTLEEISSNRGTLYYDKAVDACIRLLKDKGYKLEGSEN